jgi:hypothetical protein
MKKKTRKRLKLTREQKKAVWTRPKSNAGAGWQSRYEPVDPVKFYGDSR